MKMFLIIIKSLIVALFSFSILLIADLFSESVYDYASSEFEIPQLASLVDGVSPIGFLLFLMPAMVGVSFAIEEAKKSEVSKNFVLYFIVGVFSVVIIGFALVVSGHFIMLNGQREVSVIRYIGNLLLFSLIAFSIILNLRKANPNQSL